MNTYQPLRLGTNITGPWQILWLFWAGCCFEPEMPAFITLEARSDIKTRVVRQ